MVAEPRHRSSNENVYTLTPVNDGCSESPSCLTCPLPVCKHDFDGGRVSIQAAQKAIYIHNNRLGPDEAVEVLGIAKRTYYHMTALHKTLIGHPLYDALAEGLGERVGVKEKVEVEGGVKLRPDLAEEAKKIIANVCKTHRISIATIRGPRHTKGVVAARREMAQQLYDAGVSQSNVARLINRDHSTAIYHLRKQRTATPS